MSIKRGKRRSVIAGCGRWRWRLVIGRFRRWAFEHERHDLGMGGRTGLIVGRFFLLSFRQSGYR